MRHLTCLLVIPTLALGLGACQHQPAHTPAPPAALCNDSGLDWAVGQPNSIQTLARLKQQSGTGILNPIIPGTIVSKDRRTDRLRVYLDGNDIITAVRCE